jgi:hypothetical protein
MKKRGLVINMFTKRFANQLEEDEWCGCEKWPDIALIQRGHLDNITVQAEEDLFSIVKNTSGVYEGYNHIPNSLIHVTDTETVEYKETQPRVFSCVVSRVVKVYIRETLDVVPSITAIFKIHSS